MVISVLITGNDDDYRQGFIIIVIRITMGANSPQHSDRPLNNDDV